MLTMKSLKSTAAAAVLAVATLAVSACAGGPATAQSATAPAAATEAAPAATGPALWAVRDADTTIYLFGTFHLLPPGTEWKVGEVRTAFERSDTLRLEVAGLRDVDPGTMQQLVLSRGMDMTGPTLSSRLSDPERAQLAAAAAEVGMPAAAFDRMRPWFASMNLAVMMMMKMGLDPQAGADSALEAAATTAGMRIEGFETAEQQIGFLADISEDEQLAMLRATLRDWNRGTDMMNAMLLAWRSGNADELARIINEGVRETPALARVLLADRNARWAEWIDGRMDQPGTVFVAVGGGHLAGDDSVQAYLAQRGIQTERVQ